jgi:secondary thiamine-phosphate synthase enzyme
MKIHSSNYTFETKEQYQTIDLTQFLIEEVRASGVKSGLAFIFTGHTTGAILLNEFDPWLSEDLKNLLTRLIPNEGDYRHPDNGVSHLAGMLLSHSQFIPVNKGEPDLGT